MMMNKTRRSTFRSGYWTYGLNSLRGPSGLSERLPLKLEIWVSLCQAR
jgi:hypothetical protein